MSLHNTGGTRVFIAEDNPAILALIITRLEIAGYRTSSARDGASALHIIKSSLPTAVILDVNMPKLDGFNVLRAMRSHGASSRIPVLMLTARKSAEDVKMARSYGANDYLVRPFDDRQLLDRVGRLIRLRRSADVPCI